MKAWPDLVYQAKVGDLDAGTSVPVRYDAGHAHVVLDIPKLEAAKEAKKKAAAEWLEQHKAEQVAAADAALARENRRRSLDERGAAWRFSASATPGSG